MPAWLSSVVLLVAAASTGPEPLETGSARPDRPDGETPPQHAETPAGEYITVPWSDRPTTPAYRAIRGGYVSVQVNVDGNGNNIVGDAANEPSIAIDPTNPNRIAIGWRQFDSNQNSFRQAGFGHSDDGGATWTFPGVIEPGNFRSDPVLASSPDGEFYYYSLRGDFLCDVFISGNGGASWGPRIFAFGGDKAWFNVDGSQSEGRGNLYAAWSTAGNPHSPDQFTRSTTGGATWMSPIELPDPKPRWGTLDVDADGNLYLSGVAGSGFRVLRSSNARIAEETPTWDWNIEVDLGGPLAGGAPNPGGLLGQVWIAADRSGGANEGDVYLLATINPPGGDAADIMFARSEDGGTTWSQPIRVNDDAPQAGAWQWFGTMSVAPTGRIDVVWNDTRVSLQDNICELYYAFSEDGGRTWSTNTAVSPAYDSWAGWPQQAKIGDYYHMVSDTTGASLAYAATFNGEQDVYYLRLEPNACPADLTGDGRVAFDDLLQLLAAWGECDGCPEDLDGDGLVSFGDVLDMLTEWGLCPLPCCLPSDSCDDAPVVGDGVYAFSTRTATSGGSQLPGSCDEGNGRLINKDVWITYTPACDGVASVDICESSFDTRVAVYTADGCPGALVACNDDGCGQAGSRSSTSFVAESGQSYLIRIGSPVSERGDGLLFLECTPGS